MDQRHTDTRAIVTGAGSGIGRATARRLAAEGAAIACLDVKGYDETATEIVQDGGRAWGYECDVTDAEAVARTVDLAFVDGNHRFRDWARHLLDQGYDFRPVHIGDGAIVTSKVSIIGSDIGAHALIGAHSVVTRSIPAYCLAYGTPARVVEYFGPPDQRPAELDGQPSVGGNRSSSNQNEAGSPSGSL